MFVKRTDCDSAITSTPPHPKKGKLQGRDIEPQDALIFKLPRDLLLLLFSYMFVKQYPELRLVCRLWNNALTQDKTFSVLHTQFQRVHFLFPNHAMGRALTLMDRGVKAQCMFQPSAVLSEMKVQLAENHVATERFQLCWEPAIPDAHMCLLDLETKQIIPFPIEDFLRHATLNLRDVILDHLSTDTAFVGGRYLVIKTRNSLIIAQKEQPPAVLFANPSNQIIQYKILNAENLIVQTAQRQISDHAAKKWRTQIYVLRLAQLQATLLQVESAYTKAQFQVRPSFKILVQNGLTAVQSYDSTAFSIFSGNHTEGMIFYKKPTDAKIVLFDLSCGSVYALTHCNTKGDREFDFYEYHVDAKGDWERGTVYFPSEAKEWISHHTAFQILNAQFLLGILTVGDTEELKLWNLHTGKLLFQTTATSFTRAGMILGDYFLYAAAKLAEENTYQFYGVQLGTLQSRRMIIGTVSMPVDSFFLYKECLIALNQDEENKICILQFPSLSCCENDLKTDAIIDKRAHDSIA